MELFKTEPCSNNTTLFFFRFLEGPLDADYEDFDPDEAQTWVLGTKPGVPITFAFFKDRKILKHKLCSTSSVNTLGWASFLIKNNDDKDELHQYISTLKENDTIMVDP
jgi:hypothetical protein